VSAKGQSRCFVNDSPVPLATQKLIGELLVDLHGQHEHQSLLRTETHIGMLDDFGGLGGMVDEYKAALKRLREKTAAREELRLREQQLKEKRDFYEFQINEIDAIDPKPDEEDELERELRILENSERLFTATNTIHELLYDGERPIHDQLVLVRNQLQNLATIDDHFNAAAMECSSADAVVIELAKFIQTYNSKIEFNPDRLEELRDRLGRLSLLKKKYGGSLQAVIDHRKAIGEEVALAHNFAGVISALDEDIDGARTTCTAIAQRLSSKRHDIARKIESGIIAELNRLGIVHGQFQVTMVQHEAEDVGGQTLASSGRKRMRLNARGFDDVEFLISTNKGEEPRPLVKVASGGEISRIMLALKSILAKSDRLPVLIFDEIDVGVSGRIAQAVGMALKSLSAFHQVIAITHLPQIAGLADLHFAVFKAEELGRAATSIRQLTLDEQVQEVARLMSGAEVTNAGLEGARELMGLK
jgi:DNA repair protein RecN (Recombination protein N)